MKELINCILSRRSVRSFQEKQVSDDDVKTIIDTALYAPSGMGTQDRHFTVILNKEKLHQLNNAAEIAMGKTPGSNNSLFYFAPAIIIVSAGPANITPLADCAAALENMLIAATALNISSCWVDVFNETQEHADVRMLLTELGVPTDHKIYCTGLFGYNAIKQLPASPRKGGTVTIVS